MRNMKKWLATALALVMVFAMAACAVADGETATTYTITASDNGHTYEVYQIFTGDLSGKVLSNVKWGKNGSGTQGEVVDDTILTELAGTTGSDTAKLAVISKYVKLDIEAYGTVTNAAPLTNVPAGYYLIKDVDGEFSGKDDAYTTYIVQVVGDVAISPKSVKPTVDKQVHDETGDAETGADNGWGESADHAINESFQFKLIANLPANTNFAAYEKYKVVFTDTMSDGVTFESIASVTVDGVTLTAEQYTATATAGQAGGSWTLTINDIKSIDNVNLTDGADIVVIYNAHLNEKAQVNHESGSTTNLNKVYLEYSNNPNVSGEGAGEELGKTPEDTVWVFTYEVDNTKVDATNSANKTPLAGAGFKLYDSTGTTEIGLIYDSTLSAYRPVKGEEVAEEMKSAAETGVFNIKGLDAGTYVLKETTVPAGYNKCADVTVVIKATHAEDEAGTSATTNLTSDSNVTNTIENKQGSTLPETGGMGTTVLYVGGGVLVLAAVVLLIAKRRSNA